MKASTITFLLLTLLPLSAGAWEIQDGRAITDTTITDLFLPVWPVGQPDGAAVAFADDAAPACEALHQASVVNDHFVYVLQRNEPDQVKLGRIWSTLMYWKAHNTRVRVTLLNSADGRCQIYSIQSCEMPANCPALQ